MKCVYVLLINNKLIDQFSVKLSIRKILHIMLHAKIVSKLCLIKHETKYIQIQVIN